MHFPNSILLPAVAELNCAILVDVAVEVVGEDNVIDWDVVVWLGSGKSESIDNWLLLYLETEDTLRVVHLTSKTSEIRNKLKITYFQY